MSENPSGGWDGENKPNALAEYASEIARLRAETEAQRREIERLKADLRAECADSDLAKDRCNESADTCDYLRARLAPLAGAHERLKQVLELWDEGEDTAAVSLLRILALPAPDGAKGER